ncbi:MAG: J domain-containing protein [Magnetospirillum sp. WYHS-4]
MDADVKKHSYTIPCSSAFRDAVANLARRKKANVADLARSVVLVLPAAAIAEFPDPGEPGREDRETVVLKSGSAQGRPWRRKPRLQVRLPPGHEVAMIRRALGIALAMERGEMALRLDGKAMAAAAHANQAPPAPSPEDGRLLRETREELERLQAIVSVLAFEPLRDGVHTRDEALHVLGFPPGRIPDLASLRARFRMLATIHHPDGTYGDHRRMSQLNAAMDILRRGMA